MIAAVMATSLLMFSCACGFVLLVCHPVIVVGVGVIMVYFVYVCRVVCVLRFYSVI